MVPLPDHACYGKKRKTCLKDIIDQFPPEQEFYIGTGCAFFFIGTAEELITFSSANKINLLYREVLDHYPKILDNGYAIIIQGTEKGKYWLKSEWLDKESKNSPMKCYNSGNNARHIDGYLNSKELGYLLGTSTGNIHILLRKGYMPCIQVGNVKYVKVEDAEEFKQKYRKGAHNQWMLANT